jgi:hypothetical protein
MDMRFFYTQVVSLVLKRSPCTGKILLVPHPLEICKYNGEGLFARIQMHQVLLLALRGKLRKAAAIDGAVASIDWIAVFYKLTNQNCRFV